MEHFVCDYGLTCSYVHVCNQWNDPLYLDDYVNSGGVHNSDKDQSRHRFKLQPGNLEARIRDGIIWIFDGDTEIQSMYYYLQLQPRVYLCQTDTNFFSVSFLFGIIVFRWNGVNHYEQHEFVYSLFYEHKDVTGNVVYNTNLQLVVVPCSNQKLYFILITMQYAYKVIKTINLGINVRGVYLLPFSNYNSILTLHDNQFRVYSILAYFSPFQIFRYTNFSADYTHNLKLAQLQDNKIVVADDHYLFSYEYTQNAYYLSLDPSFLMRDQTFKMQIQFKDSASGSLVTPEAFQLLEVIDTDLTTSTPIVGNHILIPDPYLELRLNETEPDKPTLEGFMGMAVNTFLLNTTFTIGGRAYSQLVPIDVVNQLRIYQKNDKVNFYCNSDVLMIHMIWYNAKIKLTTVNLGLLIPVVGQIGQMIMFGATPRVLKEFRLIEYSIPDGLDMSDEAIDIIALELLTGEKIKASNLVAKQFTRNYPPRYPVSVPEIFVSTHIQSKFKLDLHRCIDTGIDAIDKDVIQYSSQTDNEQEDPLPNWLNFYPSIRQF